MSDIRIKLFKQQKQIYLDQKRIIGAFAGKRCISPESKVLTSDGVKEFGDISFGDRILSFDQDNNQFLFSRSSASFPKAKHCGYRVIHELGEFVASAHHLVFCYPGKYLSLEHIFSSHLEDTALLCPSCSIEDIVEKLFVSGAQNLNRTPSGYRGRYEAYNYQCDQPLHGDSTAYQVLSRPLSDAQELAPQTGPFAFEYGGALVHRKLEHSHPYQSASRSSNFGVVGPVSCPSSSAFYNYLISDISEQIPGLHQLGSRFPDGSEPHRRDELSDQYSFELKDVWAQKSNILAIEKVQDKVWWDVEVEGTNNYISGGAIHHNSGKSQIGALKAINLQETKPNEIPNDPDPYLGVVVAPTMAMMRRLTWKKFLMFSQPFIENPERDINKTHYEIKWHDGSEVIGMSADKPERLEGIKAHWLWCDEIFQMSEQFFLECMARVADTEGYLICTGSLGVQYINPKLHWAHYYFKEHPDEQTACYEWTTSDNPHFPRKELERLKDTLDPQTYRAMFELSWDFTPRSAVYDDFNEDNVVDNYVYNPMWPTYVCIDWGWAHPMAVGFFQYDAKNDTVYLFDEIISSRMTLASLYKKLIAKPYTIDGWFCDIAGNQEREQIGRSNIQWFREKGISFKYRKKAIQYGITIVRTYVKDGKGRKRFKIASQCKKSIDGMKQYKYHEKDGIIQNENPVKKDDDAVDMIRYYFHCNHDKKVISANVSMIKYM